MTRILLTEIGSGDSGDRDGAWHGASLALGPAIGAKLAALWLTGRNHARGDLYDYANKGRPLVRRGASALADHATVSGTAFYKTGLFPAELAAESPAGFVGLFAVVNAGWSDLGTGEGRGFMSNLINNISASIGFGISTTSPHAFTATMRGASGTEIAAELAHDSLNGTRYELFYAGFAPGDVVLRRRCRRDDGTLLRGDARTTGSTAIVPAGALSLDIGKAFTWAKPFDLAAGGILNTPLSTSGMDEMFDRLSVLLDDTVGLAL